MPGIGNGLPEYRAALEGLQKNPVAIPRQPGKSKDQRQRQTGWIASWFPRSISWTGTGISPPFPACALYRIFNPVTGLIGNTRYREFGPNRSTDVLQHHPEKQHPVCPRIFNPDLYLDDNTSSAHQKIALGRELFFDKVVFDSKHSFFFPTPKSVHRWINNHVWQSTVFPLRPQRSTIWNAACSGESFPQQTSSLENQVMQVLNNANRNAWLSAKRRKDPARPEYASLRPGYRGLIPEKRHGISATRSPVTGVRGCVNAGSTNMQGVRFSQQSQRLYEILFMVRQMRHLSFYAFIQRNKPPIIIIQKQNLLIGVPTGTTKDAQL